MSRPRKRIVVDGMRLRRRSTFMTHFVVCAINSRFSASRSTGKERDAESGNDYFEARYFGSSMGRFMSPDWSDEPDTIPYAEFENPQTLNLYSYARNNPMLYNDPDGHDVSVCDNNGHCNTVTNDQYKAAQQAGNSGGLSAATLDQVGNSKDANGNFTATAITNSSGQQVGTATYVPGNNPGIDPYVGNNAQGLATMSAAYKVVNTATGTVETVASIGLGGVGVAALRTALALRAGVVVGGFVLTQHAVEQAEERGVTLEEIEEAVQGVAKGNPQNGWDSVQRFYTSSCEVRVNKITGTIVTVISKISR
jgi:RHS repeat-associated protein